MCPEQAPSPEPVWFSAENLLGRLIHERYLLKRVIGAGGSGVLFAATDRLQERSVAVKLHRASEQGGMGVASRFMREGEVIASLGAHPNVVQLFDWGQHEGRFPFLVFELLQGQTLESARQEQPMDPAHVLSVLLPIMGAVAFAHERGVLHRDLKPQNIFLAQDAAGAVIPKLLDFGIAKPAEGATLTRSGAIVGTPAFMSPEQALDEDLDVRTDVWSLGVVLFSCLTGELPFGGDSHTRMLLELVSSPAPSLAAVSNRLPPNLCAAIEKALERSRVRRYQSVREFARALKSAAVVDGITLPVDPEPIGLPEWSSWSVNGLLEAEFEVFAREAGCIARYRDCTFGFQRGPGGVNFMTCAFDHARQLAARFGRFAMMIVIDASSESPGPTDLIDVLRFYDQAPLTCAAQVVRTEGALGVAHRSVMATINFVTRRSYPVKVFSNTDDAARWIAEMQATGAEVEAYEQGLKAAIAEVEAQMAGPITIVPPPPVSW